MKLYTKILLWFFLNLVILGAAFYLVFRLQFRFGLDSLLMGQADNRIQALSEVINAELNSTPASGWNEVLRRFGSAYQVQFILLRSDGSQVAGDSVTLPTEVLAKATERRGPFGGVGRGPPPGRGPNRTMGGASAEGRPKFLLHTRNPSRYWIGVCLPVPDGERRWSPALTLLAVSRSLYAGGLVFDLRPWAVVGFAAVLFSMLFWFPLVRSLTRAISQMTDASEQLAQGRFDARVPSQRRDELGRLGQAINRMAGRLSGFVTGQKRFLGDIAHELCSPIARIQVALGILEQRSDDNQKGYVADVREDVQHMSGLVNELLSFSKAGLQQKEIVLAPVNVAAIARQVVDREAPDANQVRVAVDGGLQVLAESGLLARALANIVRNAVRYAGSAGPITLAASRRGSKVTITVADSGPGVPEETVQQIFDPFFRLESSRNRDAGGIVLGLAIVKTCIEACQGTVTARNRQPSGLQVEICLNAGP